MTGMDDAEFVYEEEGPEEDICSQPESRVIDEFYEGLLPIIVEEWSDQDGELKPENSKTDQNGSESSVGSIFSNKVRVKFRNGNTYHGSTIGKRFHGDGKFSWSNGTYYEGTFRKNQMIGNGSFYYANGARYTGQVSLGHRHGAGSYITESFTYGGYFWNSLFHGAGKLQVSLQNEAPNKTLLELEKASHCLFDGEFRCNKIYIGTRVYDNGIFSGLFDEFGQRKCGKFLFKNNDSYQGHWYEDQFCDFGIYKWNNPDKYVNKFVAFRPTSYTGYWLDGQRHGVGMLEFEERTILCTWEYDLKNGPGVIFAANGDIFVSDEMFYNDHFVSGRKVNCFESAKTVIYELFCYFYPQNTEVDPCAVRCVSSEEIIVSRKESFKAKVSKLMLYAKKCDSALMPIFLPNYSIDFSDSMILDFMCKTFPHVDRCKLLSTEIRSINQVLISNLDAFEAIYKKYASFDLQLPRSDVTMTRLGLWQLYRDVFKKMLKINICSITEDFDDGWHIFSIDSQNPREKVYFWQFLKHLLSIVMLLNQNNIIKYEALREHLPFFGCFATMTTIFLREFKFVDNFTLTRTHQMIRAQPQFVITLLEQIRLHEEAPTIRSVFRFFKRFSHPECRDIPRKGHLSRVTDEEFIQCAQLIFPRMVQDNTLSEISFRVTPLEFVEILLHLFEMDIYKGKLEELVLEEVNEEISVEQFSEDTSSILSLKKEKKNKASKESNTVRSKRSSKIKSGKGDESR